MGYQEIPAVKTKIAIQDLFDALVRAHARYFHSLPKTDTILILVAQGAFETGWWESCFNFNLGNFKSVVGSSEHDWTFFECDEVLSASNAARYASDPLCVLNTPRPDGSVVVVFKPKHPVSCFQAWRDLDSASYDYLAGIVERFSDPDHPAKDAWGSAVRDDVAGYCKALKAMGYYTDDESHYQASVTSILAEVKAKNLDTTSVVPAAQALIPPPDGGDSPPPAPSA